MTTSVYIFDGALLTGSAATCGTAAPTLTKRVVKAAKLYNGTAAPVLCQVHMIASGGTASDTNRVVSRTIGIEETYLCPELVNEGLNAGGFIQALGLDCSFRYTATDITNG
jgi:hypothetical protein